jgi:two-component system, NtrC family, response regulator GlrR
MAVDEGLTETVVRPHGGNHEAPRTARFELAVVPPTGAPAGPAPSWSGEGPLCTIGSHPSNTLVIDDRSVSRFHAEVRADGDGVRIVDCDSTNGTVVDGVRVTGAFLRDGSVIEVGRVAIRASLRGERTTTPLSEHERFGDMVGRSVGMRALFAVLERAAKTDATVLLEGETGTGKEAAAEAVHAASARASGPFVVVDLGAIPATLVESELFGHERGAFTGAHQRRIGAFEAAKGGTIFLDELGELPAELQPKLLRVLEQRTIRRVGSNDRIPVDVRVVAATNRALRRMVNEGTFRSDLYFRLAVVRAELPPLRERKGDLPLLVATLLDGLGAGPAERARLLEPGFVERLAHGAWVGNVRELRNHIERCLVMELDLPVEGAMAEPAHRQVIDASLSYAQARELAIASFEREYLPALVRRHDGNVSRAAREAGIDRAYLHRLLRRHGLGRDE